LRRYFNFEFFCYHLNEKWDGDYMGCKYVEIKKLKTEVSKSKLGVLKQSIDGAFM
jgi:hypothetical protein